MSNILEEGVIELLQGKIYCNDEIVPVIIRNKPIAKTPSVSIVTASKNMLERAYFHNPLEVIRYKYSTILWINIWCDTEEERETIVEQVNTIFNQAIANHYLRCCNYNDGDCISLEAPCEALTVKNSRSEKHQCPYPQKNNYTSFFKKYNILKNTFNIDGEVELDETDINPPVLRTRLDINTEYYTYYTVGGALFNELKVNL